MGIKYGKLQSKRKFLKKDKRIRKNTAAADNADVVENCLYIQINIFPWLRLFHPTSYCSFTLLFCQSQRSSKTMANESMNDRKQEFFLLYHLPLVTVINSYK